jgi:hypothetical protein
MALAVRTLALPADILALGPRNILRRSNGERVLRFSRGKTRVIVEIEIVGKLARIIDERPGRVGRAQYLRASRRRRALFGCCLPSDS